MADFVDTYRKTVLDNGVRIVTEMLPNIRSLALGIWFDTGSRDEPEELAGISHFLEHMNFKGTPQRSAAAIARQIEGRGGHLNAFTSKEITCFHARVVDQQITKAVDVLSDITLNSTIDSTELNRERDVILEELKSVEDTPDELVFEHFFDQLYFNHPMGRSVLGTRESLTRINSKNMRKYRDNHFAGSRVVISAAGSVHHDRLVGLIERRFSDVKDAIRDRAELSRNDAAPLRQDLKTSTQQAHILIGCRSVDYSHKDKYVMLVLNTLLGGGMSSRLFQRVRERNGLAYSVFSFLETYGDTGVFGVYAGTDPEKSEKAVRLINRELKELAKKPVSARELKRTKDQLKGNLLMGLESPSARMNRLAKMEIYTHTWTPIDAVVSRIDRVTVEDIQRVAKDMFIENSLHTTLLLPN